MQIRRLTDTVGPFQWSLQEIPASRIEIEQHLKEPKEKRLRDFNRNLARRLNTILQTPNLGTKLHYSTRVLVPVYSYTNKKIHA